MRRADIHIFDNTSCSIVVDHDDDLQIDLDGDRTYLVKEEAIAAARAILKHFNVGVE